MFLIGSWNWKSSCKALIFANNVENCRANAHLTCNNVGNLQLLWRPSFACLKANPATITGHFIIFIRNFAVLNAKNIANRIVTLIHIICRLLWYCRGFGPESPPSWDEFCNWCSWNVSICHVTKRAYFSLYL